MNANGKGQKVKKSKSKKIKWGLIVAGVFVIFGVSSFFITKMFVKAKLDKVEHVSIPQDNESLGIDSNVYNDGNKEDDSITNILLLGTDSRDIKSDPGNSDSMMVLTVDKKNNKLKITSIMRDSIVNVEGVGQRKLTEAHNIGGALLTLKTINQNYNLNIKDYVQVNFVGLSKIIDYIGGVPINLIPEEASFKEYAINTYIDEISGIEKVTPQHVTKPGLQTLNGIQAVSYARIRYIGNNDFQRTERQRTVLSEIFKKLSTTNVADIGGVADTIAPYVQTTLKSDDILSMATYILTHKMTSFEQNRVPYEGMYSDQKVNGEDGLSWNKQATIDKLHQFIFETSTN
jgi:cell envelope-related function transcriptional attenuator common domain